MVHLPIVRNGPQLKHCYKVVIVRYGAVASRYQVKSAGSNVVSYCHIVSSVYFCRSVIVIPVYMIEQTSNKHQAGLVEPGPLVQM